LIETFIKSVTQSISHQASYTDMKFANPKLSNIVSNPTSHVHEE